MADRPKYWFVHPANWRTSLPVTWQGWAWLSGAFAVEIAVTRELEGPIRVFVFFAVVLVFFLEIVERLPALAADRVARFPDLTGPLA